MIGKPMEKSVKQELRVIDIKAFNFYHLFRMDIMLGNRYRGLVVKRIESAFFGDNI